MSDAQIATPAPPRDTRPWSQHRTDRLRRLWANKVPPADIAEVLGVTEYAVLAKVGRLRLGARRKPTSVGGSPWTDERMETLKRLHADGLSCSQIAKELGGGLTRNAVIGKVHRLGLCSVPRVPNPKPKKRGPSSEVARLARRMRADYRATPKPRSRVALPPTIVAEILEPTPESALTLAQLPHGPACRWIIGGTNGFETLFCAAEPVPGVSFCPYHFRKAYVPYDRNRTRAL